MNFANVAHIVILAPGGCQLCLLRIELRRCMFALPFCARLGRGISTPTSGCILGSWFYFFLVLVISTVKVCPNLIDVLAVSLVFVYPFRDSWLCCRFRRIALAAVETSCHCAFAAFVVDLLCFAWSECSRSSCGHIGSVVPSHFLDILPLLLA